MDNDLMARRLRPPSEPARQASSSNPFLPPPTDAPWDTQTAARDEIPWDEPAAEAWPPASEPWPPTDLIEDPEATVAPAATVAPSAAVEPVATQPPAAAEWPSEIEQWAPLAPAEAFARAAPTELAAPPDAPDSAADAPQMAAAPAVEASGPPVPTTEAPASSTSDTPSAPSPAPIIAVSAAPWDRPADDIEPMDMQADGPAWDAPPEDSETSDDFDFADDRPVEMLEALHDPTRAAAEIVAVSRTLEPPAADAVLVEPFEASSLEARLAADPYDATAPVVADVGSQVSAPSWPGEVSSGDDTELPPETSTVPWEQADAEAPAPDLAPLSPVPPGDLFAMDVAESPEATEAADQAAETTETAGLADQAETEVPPESTIVPWGEVEPAVPGEDLFMVAASAVAAEDAEVAEPFEAVEADVTAFEPDAERAEAADAEVVEDATEFADEEAADEASVAEVPQTVVPVELPAVTAFPATVYAAGPEAGLPANLVLRIELSIVDEAKRQAQTVPTVAQLSTPRDPEFEPRYSVVDEAVLPAAEPALSPELAEQSSWPPIWQPDAEPPQPSLATPAAAAAVAAAAPAGDWPWPEHPQPVQVVAPSTAALASDSPFETVPATPAPATPAPRVSTVADPQADLWFLSAEPQLGSESADGALAVDGGRSTNWVTVGLTIGMAVLVIVLVLVFIQLMTSLLG